MKKYPHTSKNGAALLMAVLMASVMLSAGLGVYQRTYKELHFASFWKQTQVAFAAADAGLECALYWDLHQSGATSASCFGATISDWNPSANENTTLTINTVGMCATVTITKNVTYPYTSIKSYGYNDCNASSPRRVERALSIDY